MRNGQKKDTKVMPHFWGTLVQYILQVKRDVDFFMMVPFGKEEEKEEENEKDSETMG